MKKVVAFLLLLSTLGCTYETEEDGGEATIPAAPDRPCDPENLVREGTTPRGPVCYYSLGNVATGCEGAKTRTLHEVRQEARAVAADDPYAPEGERVVCTVDGPVLQVTLPGSDDTCDETTAGFLVADERPALKACTYHRTVTEEHDPLGSRKWFDGCAGGHTGDPLQ